MDLAPNPTCLLTFMRAASERTLPPMLLNFARFCVRCPAWRAISLPPVFKLCELLRAAARRTVDNP
eukprot:5869681-Pleurochrysis_carterae.AAC.1